MPPSARSRPTYDAKSIMKIAFSLFRKRGYEATSIEQIAAHAGITKAAIYYHVAGKEVILEQGVTRALDELFNVLLDSPMEAGNTSPMDRLESVLRAAVEVELDHLDEVSVLLRLRGNTPLEREILRRRHKFDDAIAGLVQSAVQSGEARNDLDPRLAARLILGMANSLTEWLRPGTDMPREQLVDAVVKIARQGLALS
ncbi:TetR/AcrR family transcriptional regulator [Nocardia gipuzkoensis]|uniref:TetR/AcrR family transcriptional regulator n=1 Tax=Nocardia gipuzkoensis TaxID=2749991 RepID=UPI00237D5F8D|nr:TetR/AcrR family transcriptional regulator [Nocardia gipuzkoensis]MDE1675405.1 TetR/AcrR family transcriptional regulator [Nocardia gipuzkoensis]